MSNKDDDYPVIHNLTDNVTVPTDIGQSYATVNWIEPTATDNYGEPTLECPYEPGDTFSIGFTKVVYTAVDISGQSTNASFWIEVIGWYNVFLTLFNPRQTKGRGFVATPYEFFYHCIKTKKQLLLTPGF